MISASDRTKWASADTTVALDQAAVSWANESHALAGSVAYADLPQDRSGDWSDVYESQTWPVVEAQLKRAGVRLAEVLNEALR